MTPELPSKIDDGVPNLRFILDNSRPIPAAELGKVLSALAADYKKVTGGQTLVVARVQEGSIWVILQDAITYLAPFATSALEMAKAAKGLKEFAEALSVVLRPSKMAPEEVGQHWRPVELKTTRPLLKLAVDSGSTFEFEQIGPGGVRIGFKVTPPEARARQIELVEQRAQEIPNPPLLSHDDHAPRLAVDRLVQIAQSNPDGLAAVEEAVSIIATSLRGQGLEHALLGIAVELDGRGLDHLAEIVRAAIRKGRGQSEVHITK